MLKSQIVLNDTIKLNQDYELSGLTFQSLQLWEPHRGEIFTIQDISSKSFRARITELSSEKAIVHVFDKKKSAGENKLEIMLHQALPEKERMEWIIQKATELGVQTIVPFKSQRSISLEEREKKQKKVHCWPQIALRAAKQCRRPDIPQILPFCTFQESLHLAQPNQVRIFLWEKPSSRDNLKSLLDKNLRTKKISLMVGPEGGFSDQELTLARQAGFNPVNLGFRILRTETVPIVVLSILQFILGDIK